MGGGNGNKAAQKRERALKDAKKDPQSQLKSVRSVNISAFLNRSWHDLGSLLDLLYGSGIGRSTGVLSRSTPRLLSGSFLALFQSA